LKVFRDLGKRGPEGVIRSNNERFPVPFPVLDRDLKRDASFGKKVHLWQGAVQNPETQCAGEKKNTQGEKNTGRDLQERMSFHGGGL